MSLNAPRVYLQFDTFKEGLKEAETVAAVVDAVVGAVVVVGAADHIQNTLCFLTSSYRALSQTKSFENR